MARRPSAARSATQGAKNSPTTPESPKETSVSTVTEEQVEATEAEATETTEAVEATEAEATEAEAAEAPKPERREYDFTGLNTVLDEVLEERDEATGDLPTAAIEKIVVAFRELPTTRGEEWVRVPRNQGTALLEERMRNALDQSDIVLARAIVKVTDAVSVKATPAAKAKAVDPTEAFVERAAALRLALGLLKPGEGVAEDWAEKAKAAVEAASESAHALLDWSLSTAEDKGEAPKAGPVATIAVQYVLGKTKGRKASAGGSKEAKAPFTGVRRSIKNHIQEVFADLPVGAFLTVAEIASTTTPEYGADSPSGGAVSSHLKSAKFSIPGVEAASDAAGRLGARKVA